VVSGLPEPQLGKLTVADWSHDLASFLAEARPEGSIRARAALVLADTVGAIVAGSREREVATLSAAAPNRGEEATLLGTDRRLAAREAALLTGIAGTAVEMDEGNYRSGGHPAVHVVAAALPVAEAFDLSGRELINAVAVAYEASARIGAATRLRDAVHAHGTWGAIGAATAAARLLGFGNERMWHTLQMAASFCLATSRTSGLVGATVRHAYAGIAAMNGLNACDLVRAGFTGERGAVERTFGEVVGDRFDPTGIADGLGDSWLLADGFFKRYASCRETHGAIDALDEALRARGIEAVPAEAIRGITVETFAQAARLDEAAPANPLAARYSIPFALATRIVRGGASVDDFGEEAVRDERIRALAGKVAVNADAGLTARLPGERVTRVAVVLADSGTIAAEVPGSPGDPSLPLADVALSEKFQALTTPSWGTAGKPTFDAWLDIDRAPSVAALCAAARNSFQEEASRKTNARQRSFT
jgi:2-methylcitrate dehydratase PrpD